MPQSKLKVLTCWPVSQNWPSCTVITVVCEVFNVKLLANTQPTFAHNHVHSLPHKILCSLRAYRQMAWSAYLAQQTGAHTRSTKILRGLQPTMRLPLLENKKVSSPTHAPQQARPRTTPGCACRTSRQPSNLTVVRQYLAQCLNAASQPPRQAMITCAAHQTCPSNIRNQCSESVNGSTHVMFCVVGAELFAGLAGWLSQHVNTQSHPRCLVHSTNPDMM